MHTTRRIAPLRKLRRMSQEELGAYVGLSKSQISRLETGRTGVDLDVAVKIAKALQVPLPEVLGIDMPVHFEDVVEYTPKDRDPLSRLAAGDQQHLYEVTSDVVDELGVDRGSIILVDKSESQIQKVAPLTLVLLEYRAKKDEAPILLVRQHVPPSLFVTNSKTKNFQALNSTTDLASIAGIVIMWRHGNQRAI